MVNYLSMTQLFMLFIEWLSEPLRGWFRAYQPATLQDAINRARDMQDAVPKNRFLPKFYIPQKGKEIKQQQQEPFGKGKLDDETRKDLRRRRLCFSCQQPWAPGHRCTKGKAHYIEVFSESEDEEDNLELNQVESQGMGAIQEEI